MSIDILICTYASIFNIIYTYRYRYSFVFFHFNSCKKHQCFEKEYSQFIIKQSGTNVHRYVYENI